MQVEVITNPDNVSVAVVDFEVPKSGLFTGIDLLII